MVIFSMAQVYSIRPIFLYTLPHIELHLFFLSILVELQDKLDKSMEPVNCKNNFTLVMEIVCMWNLEWCIINAE